MKTRTIAVISFLASGVFHVTSSSGEKLRCRKYESERFEGFLFRGHHDKVEAFPVRHPNRMKKISNSISPSRLDLSHEDREAKDNRKKVNAKARWNTTKFRNH